MRQELHLHVVQRGSVVFARPHGFPPVVRLFPRVRDALAVNRPRGWGVEVLVREGNHPITIKAPVPGLIQVRNPKCLRACFQETRRDELFQRNRRPASHPRARPGSSSSLPGRPTRASRVVRAPSRSAVSAPAHLPRRARHGDLLRQVGHRTTSGRALRLVPRGPLDFRRKQPPRRVGSPKFQHLVRLLPSLFPNLRDVERLCLGFGA